MNGKKPVADDPVGAAEFDALIEPLAPSGSIAIAVSGGNDSMALAVLCRQWAQSPDDAGARQVHALVVDHGFRSGSADEARLVVHRLAGLGVSATILTRTGDTPAAGRQALGRAARYDLMAGWCRANGVMDLVVAHHQDDQAETVIMRALAGSGVDGLAAMRPVRHFNGIRILRPLLSVSRARLAATCRTHQVDHVEDPSNQDPAYTRVQVRNWLTGRGDLPVDAATSGRMSVLADRSARATSALDHYTDGAVADMVQWHRFGWARLDLAALKTLPQEIVIRVLARVGRGVGGVELPLAQLERAVPAVLHGQARTLGRAEFRAVGPDGIGAWRQARHLPVMSWPVGDHDIVWDNRFRLRRQMADDMPVIGPAGDRTMDAGLTVEDRRALATAPALDGRPVLIDGPGTGETDEQAVTAGFVAGILPAWAPDTAT